MESNQMVLVEAGKRDEAAERRCRQGRKIGGREEKKAEQKEDDLDISGRKAETYLHLPLEATCLLTCKRHSLTNPREWDQFR